MKNRDTSLFDIFNILRGIVPINIFTTLIDDRVFNLFPNCNIKLIILHSVKAFINFRQFILSYITYLKFPNTDEN